MDLDKHEILSLEIDTDDPGATRGELESNPKPKSRHLTYVPGVKILLYSPPRQRQKWGSNQILPHVNWGDLFFDLFYVAGFYNMGYILLNDPTLEGILYFLTCFFPLSQLWQDKTMYDARFVTGDDIFHNITETAFLVLLATAVSYISPVTKMSDPTTYVDMFGFALSLTLALSFNSSRVLEYYLYGQGQQKVIQNNAKTEMKFKILPLLFYAAATIAAGVAYFQKKDSNRREVAEDAEVDSICGTPNYIPIILILAGYVSHSVIMYVSIAFCFPKKGEHKKYILPMHIEFVIHRQGEWTMLVLGETVLSLLITGDVEDDGYFSAFYCGIVTIILLQLLHFRNQPHDPNAHAMRRHKNAGVAFGTIFPFYSVALITVGVCYKLFLYDLANKKRRLLYEDHGKDRWLAGEKDFFCGPTSDEKERNVAHIFSVAMAIVFLSLDTMLVLHVGLKKGLNKCKSYGGVCEVTGKAKYLYNIKGILLVAFRVAVTMFVATLGLWKADSADLPILGLVAVACQLLARFLGNIYFHVDEDLGLDHHHHHEGITDGEGDI